MRHCNVLHHTRGLWYWLWVSGENVISRKHFNCNDVFRILLNVLPPHGRSGYGKMHSHRVVSMLVWWFCHNAHSRDAFLLLHTHLPHSKEAFGESVLLSSFVHILLDFSKFFHFLFSVLHGPCVCFNFLTSHSLLCCPHLGRSAFGCGCVGTLGVPKSGSVVCKQ